ncbi:MAG: hypothetical protein ACLSVD_04710 [Eggerthellaceae bacterium]
MSGNPPHLPEDGDNRPRAHRLAHETPRRTSGLRRRPYLHEFAKAGRVRQLHGGRASCI